MNRQFVAFFFFVGWDCFSLGLHICLSEPNIEIHLPFGFIRVGWTKHCYPPPVNLWQVERQVFGWGERWN